jgi:cation diffusion facilitator CzcD-associated flavoprotein CzcO
MNDTVEKYGLRDCMKFSHTVTGAHWNDEEGLWYVKVMDPNGIVFEDTCNLLFNGSGILKYVEIFESWCSMSNILQ